MQQFAELRRHSKFASVSDMNLAVRAFLYRHKSALTDATVAVFKHLARYSCKVPGVSFAEVAFIASKLGISERTVQRALKTLEKEYGVIERIPRKNSANVIVIQPQDASILPVMSPTGVTPNVTPSNTDEASDLLGYNEKTDAEALYFKLCSLRGISDLVEKDVDAPVPVDSSIFVPDYVPRKFVQIVRRIFTEAHEILALWNVVRMAGRKLGAPVDEIAALKAFTHADFERRRGRTRDFHRYYYGTLVGMARPSEQGSPLGASLKPQPIIHNMIPYQYNPAFAPIYEAHQSTFIASPPDDGDLHEDKYAAFKERYGDGCDPEQEDKYSDFYRMCGRE